MRSASGIVVTFLLGLAALLALGAGVAVPLFLVGATFAAPAWLHVAWVAPFVLLLGAAGDLARRRGFRRIGSPAAVERLVEDGSSVVRPLRALLAAAAILLLAVAAARPQWGTSEEQLVRRGVDVFVCVDTSKSMLAEDVKPNRLVRARLALDSLLDRLGGDRVGLVAFAGDARLLCPLTLDRSAVRMFVESLEPETVQRPGTALASALELVDSLRVRDGTRATVAVLLTDGEDHDGEAVETATRLREHGVVVHALGLGRPEGVPIPIVEDGPDGRRSVGFVRDEDGSPVMSRLQADGLAELAAAGGGSFAPVTSSEMEIAALAASIDELEKSEATGRRTSVRTDRGVLFLAAAFALLLLETLLPDGARLRHRRTLARVERMALAHARESSGAR